MNAFLSKRFTTAVAWSLWGLAACLKRRSTLSARARDEAELDALSDHLLGVVEETWQPLHVSLWLRPERAPS